jgi:hypothetical protein
MALGIGVAVLYPLPPRIVAPTVIVRFLFAEHGPLCADILLVALDLKRFRTLTWFCTLV